MPMTSFRILPLLGLIALTGACSRETPATAAAEPAFSSENSRSIVLQTDWFPQAEHGGYYQALARGFYAEAGLSVTIVPGGPGMAKIKQIVARGDADFGLNRGDEIILAIARENLPFAIVGAAMQHDTQALLIHSDSPVRSFSDLDGSTVVANPGQAWLAYIQKRYDVTLNLVPNNGNLATFLSNPGVIQQCILTSEPFTARARGVAVRTLPLAESGYDNYSVIFGRRDFVEANPEATRAFVAASIRGWRDFLEGDPAPAFDEILRRNPSMSRELMAFAREELIRNHTVLGDPADGEIPGRLDPARLRSQIEALVNLGILENPIPVGEVASRSALKPE